MSCDVTSALGNALFSDDKQKLPSKGRHSRGVETCSELLVELSGKRGAVRGLLVCHAQASHPAISFRLLLLLRGWWSEQLACMTEFVVIVFVAHHVCWR